MIIHVQFVISKKKYLFISYKVQCEHLQCCGGDHLVISIVTKIANHRVDFEQSSFKVHPIKLLYYLCHVEFWIDINDN